MRGALRVAAVQMRSTPDAASNLDKVLAMVRRAANARTQLVCFPENALFLSTKDSASLAVPVQVGARATEGPVAKVISSSCPSPKCSAFLPILTHSMARTIILNAAARTCAHCAHIVFVLCLCEFVFVFRCCLCCVVL
jgi:predicted amidohydrolase